MDKFRVWWKYKSNTAESGMHVIFALIAMNVLMYVMIHPNGAMYPRMVFIPMLFTDGAWWQPITSLFMHAGFFHILFNMYALFLFGSLIAPEIGGRRFLFLYFFAGLVGNFAWLSSHINTNAYLLGASGAVMGIIIAAAMVRPNIDMFFLFVPFPIKLRTLAIIFVAIDIFNEVVSGNQGGVAYIAHIGGFFGGYLYMRFFLKQFVVWDPLTALFKKKQDSRSSSVPPGWTFGAPPPPPPAHGSGTEQKPPTGKVTQNELDYLLDKISRTGINSLTEFEMERLRKAREQMRGEGR